MQTCRQYWRNLHGRCVLNFNWNAIDHDSVVLISASEYRPDNADLTHSPRFVGDANIRVRNISPHGPPYDPNHGVTFVVTVDWDSPLDIVTDITVLDAKPIDRGWSRFQTTRLPHAAAGTDLGANTDHRGNLYIFFGDSGDNFSKPIGVIRRIAGNPAELANLGSEFLPWEYRIRFNPTSPPVSIGRDQTPTGAFIYDGYCYVFVVYRLNVFPDEPSRDYVSALTRSPDPEASAGVFDFIAGVDGRVLGQVAPVVIQNHEYPNLPQSNTDGGLMMFGQAALPDGKSRISLAWMPLRVGQTANPNEVWYYTGDAQAPKPWSPFSRDAKPLVDLPYFWSSISAGRIPGTGKWLLLYQKAIGADDTAKPAHDAFNLQGIYARVGATPWDWSDEFEIFNPDRDGAWASGLMDDPRKSFAYGAFLLNPYTQWDSSARTATIYYLMSTFSPYQAVVMRSRIKVP